MLRHFCSSQQKQAQLTLQHYHLSFRVGLQQSMESLFLLNPAVSRWMSSSKAKVFQPALPLEAHFISGWGWSCKEILIPILLILLGQQVCQVSSNHILTSHVIRYKTARSPYPFNSCPRFFPSPKNLDLLFFQALPLSNLIFIHTGKPSHRAPIPALWAYVKQ